jgi:hypothetical protein
MADLNNTQVQKCDDVIGKPRDLNSLYLMQAALGLPRQEGELVPLADKEWDIFINTRTMNTANCLYVPLAGSTHLFATSARELADSLDHTSCMFADNLTKVIFLVEHLPKHHSVLSKV